MGRRAGVTATETRSQILRAAALVFGRRGYEGASIAEITSEAGLSSGAIYAHYPSKAQLFIATLRAHTRDHVRQVLDAGGVNFLATLGTLGSGLDRRPGVEGSLLMEAIVAGKRDPEVAELLAGAFTEREGLFADLARQSQQAGALDPGVSPEALARFTLMVALGALMAAAIDLPPVDHGGWSDLISALIQRAKPPSSTGDPA